VVQAFTNLYGCRIGDETRIGTFVEIQRGAVIGARCKIQSHAFVCEGVEIHDEAFVGHGVMSINDRRPRAAADDGSLQTGQDWTLERTVVGKGASIGSGVTILCGVTVGEGAVGSIHLPAAVRRRIHEPAERGPWLLPRLGGHDAGPGEQSRQRRA